MASQLELRANRPQGGGNEEGKTKWGGRKNEDKRLLLYTMTGWILKPCTCRIDKYLQNNKYLKIDKGIEKYYHVMLDYKLRA